MSKKHIELRGLYAKHDRLTHEQARLQQKQVQIQERLHQVDEAIHLVSSDQNLSWLPPRRYHIPINDLLEQPHRFWAELTWIVLGLGLGLILARTLLV